MKKNTVNFICNTLLTLFSSTFIATNIILIIPSVAANFLFLPITITIFFALLPNIEFYDIIIDDMLIEGIYQRIVFRCWLIFYTVNNFITAFRQNIFDVPMVLITYVAILLPSNFTSLNAYMIMNLLSYLKNATFLAAILVMTPLLFGILFTIMNSLFMANAPFVSILAVTEIYYTHGINIFNTLMVLQLAFKIIAARDSITIATKIILSNITQAIKRYLCAVLQNIKDICCLNIYNLYYKIINKDNPQRYQKILAENLSNIINNKHKCPISYDVFTIYGYEPNENITVTTGIEETVEKSGVSLSDITFNSSLNNLEECIKNDRVPQVYLKNGLDEWQKTNNTWPDNQQDITKIYTHEENIGHEENISNHEKTKIALTISSSCLFIFAYKETISTAYFTAKSLIISVAASLTMPILFGLTIAIISLSLIATYKSILLVNKDISAAIDSKCIFTAYNHSDSNTNDRTYDYQQNNELDKMLPGCNIC